MLWTIIVMVIVGLIAGALARLLVPGKDSIIGGFLGYLLFHHDAKQGAFQTSGLLGSVIGAIIALLIYRKIGGRSRRGGMLRT
jgi:uncharacterized membrane protein YeaQ/YmgE (transglycosylase-associated protein family)